MTNKNIVIELTEREIDAVWIAMLNIADDRDEAFPESRDRAAFNRALRKIRKAADYRLEV